MLCYIQVIILLICFMGRFDGFSSFPYALSMSTYYLDVQYLGGEGRTLPWKQLRPEEPDL
jgi:hypothetical protein